jgi:hypothetical protein
MGPHIQVPSNEHYKQFSMSGPCYKMGEPIRGMHGANYLNIAFLRTRTGREKFAVDIRSPIAPGTPSCQKKEDGIVIRLWILFSVAVVSSRGY